MEELFRVLNTRRRRQELSTDLPEAEVVRGEDGLIDDIVASDATSRTAHRGIHAAGNGRPRAW
jgi:hypothetical protein